MTQLPLTFRQREFVLARVEANAATFREDFHAWISSNWHVWEGFEREANRIYDRGRRHYSSRTIWEVMRHERALAENDSDFKLNNNYAPEVSRLYLLMYPERQGFFELRENSGRVAA